MGSTPTFYDFRGYSDHTGTMQLVTHVLLEIKVDVLCSDLGKFVQVAILIGRKVKPNHFFRGTNVQWDKRSLLQVKGIYEAQYNMGEEFFTVENVYRGDVILVTKTISELLELFYCM